MKSKEEEVKVKCETGFCIICGESNRNPIRISGLYVCQDCFRTRTDEIFKLRLKLEEVC